MEKLEKLIDRITKRVNINLRHFFFSTGQYVKNFVPLDQLGKFYSFYGISPNHALHFHFSNSNIAGTYFLGRCKVDNSVLYKCDIRGDELKAKGTHVKVQDIDVTLDDDETIWIKDSFLIKTLVHSFSHDPEKMDLYLIKNSASMPYANIHGSPLEGCFLSPFCTVDLSSLRNCIIGTYSYVQVGELSNKKVESGRVWIKKDEAPGFNFNYRFPPGVVESKYIAFEPHKGAMGMFMDFAHDRKTDFQRLYDAFSLSPPMEKIPKGASINRYSVFKGESTVDENVLVAQRAFLENATLGKGANAQENCYISYSHLEGYNVTAHGATIIYSNLKKNVFVGFNSFLHGTMSHPLVVGEGSIVMPHTIIDTKEKIEVPPGQLVWGYITTQEDLKNNSIALDELSKVEGHISVGGMYFSGSGSEFVKSFQHRINKILNDNGAFYNSETGEDIGHAQKEPDISFNIIQHYPKGPYEGLVPTIDIESKE